MTRKPTGPDLTPRSPVRPTATASRRLFKGLFLASSEIGPMGPLTVRA